MTTAFDQLLTRYEDGGLDRRSFLQAVTAVAVAAGTASTEAAGLIEARGLHHVEVKSIDFQKTGEFYKTLLGVPVEFRKDRAIVPLADGTHLSIGSAPTQASFDHYAFSIPGMDGKKTQALADRLAKSGVQAAPRGESLFVTDPDGRRFQIVPPDFKV